MAESDLDRSEKQGALPPLPIRAIARGLSAVIARAPFLWPVLKTPVRRFWERAADRWDDRIRPDSAEHLAALAAACDALEGAPHKVLELGTGTGAGALMLARRFPEAEVWAVDLAEAMIREAERKAPADAAERLHFSVADAGALPFEDASFDLVCQLNLPLYADQIARVLAPGGHVVIASSRGPRTPYYTPESVVRRRFEKKELHTLPSGQAGEGTYFLARKPPAS